MKLGSKYYPLYERLSRCEDDSVTLALPDIEQILGGKLPDSAWTKRAWWSNRNKGALQANAWIEAGYQVEAIDMERHTVTFTKFEAEYAIQRVDGEITWDRAAIKALRKHMALTQAQFATVLGVRRQTVSEWENGVYLPDRSTSKHLELVAEKEAFDTADENSSP